MLLSKVEFNVGQLLFTGQNSPASSVFANVEWMMGEVIHFLNSYEYRYNSLILNRIDRFHILF